jgi:hypothetical protein
MNAVGGQGYRDFEFGSFLLNEEQRYPSRTYLISSILHGVLLFSGSVVVFSVVISLYFLEHYPACLLLLLVPPEENPRDNVLMTRLSLTYCFRRVSRILKQYGSCDWVCAR